MTTMWASTLWTIVSCKQWCQVCTVRSSCMCSWRKLINVTAICCTEKEKETWRVLRFVQICPQQLYSLLCWSKKCSTQPAVSNETMFWFYVSSPPVPFNKRALQITTFISHVFTQPQCLTCRRLRVTLTSCHELSLNFPLTGSTMASKAPEPRLITRETAPSFSARLT